MNFEKVGVFLVILGSLAKAVTIVDHHPDDEYFIEHEISHENAIAEAKLLKLYPGPIPGCKSCSSDEMTYCRDGGVINDHCCCDNGPDDEVFRFVPHVCRIGPEACQVKAGDCAEYTRLRECCCHTYHAQIWKNIASRSTTISNYFSNILFIIILLSATAFDNSLFIII